MVKKGLNGNHVVSIGRFYSNKESCASCVFIWWGKLEEEFFIVPCFQGVSESSLELVSESQHGLRSPHFFALTESPTYCHP